MVAARRLEWRQTALDIPLGLLVALVLFQLALGNRSLASWALAPPVDPAAAVEFPAPLYAVGTVSPHQTVQSLLLFATYLGAYVLVVNLIRGRKDLDRLVRALLFAGGLLSFLGLIDYLAGEGSLIRWRESSAGGRLIGTFLNPNHFGAWLAMLTCLGTGYLAARPRRRSQGGSLADVLHSGAAREAAVRHYLPFISLGLMSLTLVCTLSRGAVLSLLATLVVLLVFLGRLGRMRWSLALIAALLAVTLGYGAWIGLDPFVARVREGDYAGRWNQWVATLPMLTGFPLLGVGLGAYRDIYRRYYQPPAVDPGAIFPPYAHSDLLQLGVEVGLVGMAVVGFAVWRITRDLVGAHLLGRGHCPVGGGEGTGAQRHDPYSIGIALGSLGSVFALSVHSAVDFSARIPANGILAAGCLGIATVALHTRFSAGGDRYLTAAPSRPLGASRLLPLTAAATAVIVSLALVSVPLRAALVEAKLRGLQESNDLARAGAAVAIDGSNPRALQARAERRLEAARQLSNRGQADIPRAGQDRKGAALDLLSGAIQDLRTALAATPADPVLHESLAQAYGVAAAVDPSPASGHARLALSHLQRAIASAPGDPLLYRSLARLAASLPQPAVDVGLRASREAVRLDPSLLPDLTDRFLSLGLDSGQWLAAVPDSALDRLHLGGLLEERGRLDEADRMYQRSLERASGSEEPLIRWALARLLIRRRSHQAASAQLDAALQRDPQNPELHLARAQARAALGDPSALEAHRRAVDSAELLARKPGRDPLVFQLETPRARALIAERVEQEGRLTPVRYRRALAQHLADRQLWDQALREWEELLAEAPLDPLAHFSKGVALEAIGSRGEAIEAYRKSVSLDGRTVRFRLRLAQSLWASDQYYQAITEWRAVTAQEPDNVDARLALARAYLKVGDRIQAFLEYQHVLRITPNHREARQGLAGLTNPAGR